MKPQKLCSMAIVALVVLLSMLMMSCNEQPISFVAENHEVVSPEFQRMRSLAANLAKVLARDLNENEEHRKEVFSKIANKFDGDFDILFASLYDRTLGEIQKFSKVTASDDPHNFGEVHLKDLREGIPKLELMMPYMRNWTDRKISEAGGLIVAYYPFGLDDRSLKEITGYDKHGNEVKIKLENAASFPYILLRTNERTDNNGFLKQRMYEPNLRVGIQSLSIHGIDPKLYEVTKKSDWKEMNLSDLGENAGLITLLPTVCPEEGCGGGGGGGGGTTFKLYAQYLKVNASIEFPTEGDIEVYFKYINASGWVSTQAFNMPNNTNENLIPEANQVILTFTNSLAETPLEVWDEDDISDDVIIYEYNNLKIYNNATYANPPVNTFEGQGVGYPYIGGNFYSYSHLIETAMGRGSDVNGSYLKAYIDF